RLGHAHRRALHRVGDEGQPEPEGLHGGLLAGDHHHPRRAEAAGGEGRVRLVPRAGPGADGGRQPRRVQLPAALRSQQHQHAQHRGLPGGRPHRVHADRVPLPRERRGGRLGHPVRGRRARVRRGQPVLRPQGPVHHHRDEGRLAGDVPGRVRLRGQRATGRRGQPEARADRQRRHQLLLQRPVQEPLRLHPQRARAADRRGRAEQLGMHALLLAVLLGAEPTGFHPELHPILQVAGGLEGELPWAATYRVPRLTTQMVSRFGLRAALADWIDAESEFEANAGYHGASTWEGQAALSVRNQLIRFRGARWKVEVGRVTDEASVDYFSQHVADFLIADPFTRDPFLYTGYNRGNG